MSSIQSSTLPLIFGTPFCSSAEALKINSAPVCTSTKALKINNVPLCTSAGALVIGTDVQVEKPEPTPVHNTGSNIRFLILCFLCAMFFVYILSFAGM
jgi:hypothetical protein